MVNIGYLEVGGNLILSLDYTTCYITINDVKFQCTDKNFDLPLGLFFRTEYIQHTEKNGICFSVKSIQLENFMSIVVNGKIYVRI